MPIADALSVERYTQLKSSAAEKIAKFSGLAEARVRTLIGHDRYEEIAEGPDDDTFDRLLQAESLISTYFGLQFLNLRPTELGGFTKMVGYGESATEMLMGERELWAIRGRIYEMAVELLDDIRDIVPEDPSEFEQSGIDSFDAGPFTIS